jgi:hypothetical protein
MADVRVIREEACLRGKSEGILDWRFDSYADRERLRLGRRML